MKFKDHFSGHAAIYRDFRPGYPDALYRWLAGLCEQYQLCWDCATGNGQAAVPLAELFDRVFATDASATQIEAAAAAENVEYRVGSAEDSGLSDGSVDLVTVAQALHWFSLDAFYAEVDRVLKPGGVLAVWTYTAQEMAGPVGKLVARLHREIVGPYWPPERIHVDAGYRSLSFPYAEFSDPNLSIEVNWNREQLLGYLHSWSATQRYQQERRADPTDLIMDELLAVWPDPAQTRLLRWPLKVRAGGKP